MSSVPRAAGRSTTAPAEESVVEGRLVLRIEDADLEAVASILADMLLALAEAPPTDGRR